MFAHKTIVGGLDTNCYIVGDENAKDILVIDPGGEADRILNFLANLEITPTEIVLTHSHCDHIGAAPNLREHFKIPITIHELDAPNLEDPKLNFSATFTGSFSFKADRRIKEGHKWPIGKGGLTVLHTPGHTVGSISLVAAGMVFCGDLIFKNGIGRTDIPGADYKTLAKSVKRILGLLDTTVVYPGHGPQTTIKDERLYLTGL